jgi:hypothetical protein
MYHTGDAGNTWSASTGDISKSIGHSIAAAGFTIYSGTDMSYGLYKTTDKGRSWKNVKIPTWRVAWVATTATKVYASCGYLSDQAQIIHASLSNDTLWTKDPVPQIIGNCPNNPAVTFDGSHYIIVAVMHKGGIWRYVEP